MLPDGIAVNSDNVAVFLRAQLESVAIIFKACVCYFSLFLKDKCISSLFQTNYIEKKFNLQLFFLLTASRTFIVSRATTRYRLLETSRLEKITICNRDNARDVAACQMNKARREVSQTNQVQIKMNIMKGLQTSVIRVIPGSTCH